MVTIEVLGFVPRTRVSPETSLVSSGKRLSSAEMVSDSVPVCSMVRSPCPASSTFVKPLTSRCAVASWPEPLVVEHAASNSSAIPKAKATRDRIGTPSLSSSGQAPSEGEEPIAPGRVT